MANRTPKRKNQIQKYHAEKQDLTEVLDETLGERMRYQLPRLLVQLIADYAMFLKIEIESLPLALETIWSAKKIPVVMDVSGRIDIYFRYRHCSCLDMRNILLRSINNMKETSKANYLSLEEMRKSLVAGMKHGSNLVIMMRDSAPDMLSTFSHPDYFPTQKVFQLEEIRKEKNWSRVVRDEDMKVVGASDNVRWFDVHPEFNVVVTMQHERKFYGRALQHCIPWKFCDFVEIIPEKKQVLNDDDDDDNADIDLGLPDFCAIYAR